MAAKTYRTAAGTMTYTDVGTGAPVVFLHGNPTSAHLYRHLIEALAPEYRCIAPDLLGFGRSDAPKDVSYRPPAQAARVESLLSALDCDDLTLVLHDWGGPLGLAYALRHPERIRRLVLFNTWAWSLDHRPLIQIASGIAGTLLGRLSIQRANAFARLVMPFTLGNTSPPTPAWLTTYAQALSSPSRRRACWTLAKSLRAESRWLRALWTRRAPLRTCPALLCWGMADPAFGCEPTLHRWQSVFTRARVQRYPGVGHYVPEEVGPALASPLRSFLHATADASP